MEAVSKLTHITGRKRKKKQGTEVPVFLFPEWE